jgi:hypothetical protein
MRRHSAEQREGIFVVGSVRCDATVMAMELTALRRYAACLGNSIYV